MREILFRGKPRRLHAYEWVHGCLMHHRDGISKIYSDEIDYVVGVIPETVGQYTGLTDKNGKKIFEGDIVSFNRVNALGLTTSRIGDVRYYDELPIFYVLATTGDAWDWVECEQIEVIGNIHDNPELLGAE